MRAIYATVFAFAAIGTAQSALAADGCDAVLLNGVMASTNYKSTDYFKISLYKDFLSRTYEEATDDSKVGLSGSYGLIMGKADYSRSEFESKKSEIRNILNLDLVKQNTTELALSSGDATIVGAWSACKKDAGPNLDITYTRPTAVSAVLEIDWHAGQTILTTTTLKNDIVLPEGIVATGAQDCLKKDYVFQVAAGASCIVPLKLTDAKSGGQIAVTTLYGSQSVYISPRWKLVTETRPFPVNLGVCNNAAQGVGTDPSEPWVTWGQGCPARLIDRASPGQQATRSYTISLSAEQIAQGYRFIQTSADAAVNFEWGKMTYNHCATNPSTVTPFAFTYGYTATAAKSHNVTVVCSVRPSIEMTRTYVEAF